jgi:hypothetical protein
MQECEKGRTCPVLFVEKIPTKHKNNSSDQKVIYFSAVKVVRRVGAISSISEKNMQILLRACIRTGVCLIEIK